MSRVISVTEWVEIFNNEHLVQLKLGDEMNTEGEHNYSFTTTPLRARAMAEELISAADDAENFYGFDDEEPTNPGEIGGEG